MINLPEGLSARVTPTETASLRRAVDAIGEEIASVYSANVLDHRESRGDNSQLFGMKIWVHGRFRLQRRFEDDPDVRVIDANGSYTVKASPFSLGVYKLGDFVDDDIHASFPDASPTKRGYGERNRAQLPLFEYSRQSPLPEAARFSLNELIVGHFGNSRDGLVKWYLGAFIVGNEGQASWAWVQKQELPGERVDLARSRPPMVPFSAREAESVEVRVRRASASQSE
jgi:hypothetical protein